ncbi:MAG: hydroxyisourate hydrolase [Lutibacter sp.]
MNKNHRSFLLFIDVVFEIKNNQHRHVPITLSEFGCVIY